MRTWSRSARGLGPGRQLHRRHGRRQCHALEPPTRPLGGQRGHPSGSMSSAADEFSCRLRVNSVRSFGVRLSACLAASRFAFLTHPRMASADGSCFRLSSTGDIPACTSSIIWLRISFGYVAFHGIVDLPLEKRLMVGCPRNRISSSSRACRTAGSTKLRPELAVRRYGTRVDWRGTLEGASGIRGTSRTLDASGRRS